MALTDKLTNIADAIRSKTGTSDPLTLDAMPSAINSISGTDNTFLKSVLDRSVTTITAGNLAGVTNIGNGAFYNCTSLVSIDLPDNINSIGAHAFYGCRSLSTFNITNNVTFIGGSAFYQCSGLTNFTIPEGVYHHLDHQQRT